MELWILANTLMICLELWYEAYLRGWFSGNLNVLKWFRLLFFFCPFLSQKPSYPWSIKLLLAWVCLKMSPLKAISDTCWCVAWHRVSSKYPGKCEAYAQKQSHVLQKQFSSHTATCKRSNCSCETCSTSWLQPCMLWEVQWIAVFSWSRDVIFM